MIKVKPEKSSELVYNSLLEHYLQSYGTLQVDYETDDLADDVKSLHQQSKAELERMADQSARAGDIMAESTLPAHSTIPPGAPYPPPAAASPSVHSGGKLGSYGRLASRVRASAGSGAAGCGRSARAAL